MSRVFVSYSRRGNGPRWKAALLEALALFARHGVLDVWEDGRIRVSSRWDDDIVAAIGEAELAVLLLTPESLASEYIVAKELPLLRARQQEGLPVFPIVCEPCAWQEQAWLGATQVATLPGSGQQNEFRRIATEIAERLGRDALAKLRRGGEPPRIELGKLPPAAGALIGREQELAMLDLAFAARRTAIASLVAWGGAGKTALVREWLARLERERWPGLRRVYAWSFYSQGTSEDRQASEDLISVSSHSATTARSTAIP